jgi:hypothetical protein
MGLRPTHRNESHGFVTPAKAGVHVPTSWIPAPPLSRRTSFAGMTLLSAVRIHNYAHYLAARLGRDGFSWLNS